MNHTKITVEEVITGSTIRYKFIVWHPGRTWGARSVRSWPTRAQALAAGKKEYPNA